VKENLKAAWRWFRQSATIVGLPVMLLVVTMGFQKFLFTTTCWTAGYQCQYALGSEDSMANYMSDLLNANPGADLDVRSVPRRNK
jgi:hypothetical protein